MIYNSTIETHYMCLTHIRHASNLVAWKTTDRLQLSSDTGTTHKGKGIYVLSIDV